MKLSHLQEARYHKSPILDWVNKSVEKLETEIELYFNSNGTGREEIGMRIDRQPIPPEVIHRDLSSAFESAGEEGDEDGETYWHIKTVPHPIHKRVKIRINVVLDTNNNLLVVYWI